VQFFFGNPVLQLHWKSGAVEAITKTDSYFAKKALVTVSIGVLQKGGITFSPALNSQTEAAKKLGFGHVVKANFVFEQAFWKQKEQTENKDLSRLSFLFTEETIPTWWTQHPKQRPLLTGWLGGPKAMVLSTLDKEALFRKALHSLSSVFGIDILHLEQLLSEKHLYNWSADPFFEGAYSYAVIDGEKYMREILQPVDSTLYFAGEGLHNGLEIGTVEAAFQSGRSVAQQLIAGF
jgi:monoamine oxidase